MKIIIVFILITLILTLLFKLYQGSLKEFFTFSVAIKPKFKGKNDSEEPVKRIPPVKVKDDNEDEEKKKRIKEDKSKKESEKKVLSSKEILLNKKEEELNRKEIELSKKEVNPAKKEAELIKKEAELNKKEVELAKKEAEPVKKEAELAKKEAELLRKETEKREAELTKKETDLLKKEADFIKKETECMKMENDSRKQQIEKQKTEKKEPEKKEPEKKEPEKKEPERKEPEKKQPKKNIETLNTNKERFVLEDKPRDELELEIIRDSKKMVKNAVNDLNKKNEYSVRPINYYSRPLNPNRRLEKTKRPNKYEFINKDNVEPNIRIKSEKKSGYDHKKPGKDLYNSYGFSYMPPETWSVPQDRPPVCIPQNGFEGEALPLYTKGTPLDALELEQTLLPKFRYEEVYDPKYYYPGWKTK